jgi:hypothetical protein
MGNFSKKNLTEQKRTYKRKQYKQVALNLEKRNKKEMFRQQLPLTSESYSIFLCHLDRLQ